MDTWKYYGITHRDHAICNPMSTTKLEQLIRVFRLEQGARILDIASGKGEFHMHLSHYEELSPKLASKVIEAAKKDEEA